MDWSKLRERLVPGAQPQVVPPRIKLPVLPTVVQEFMRLADNPNASQRELGVLVETDATLSCELLKYANSSAFASRVKVSNCQQAIGRLGIRASRMFLMAAAVQQTMKASRSKLINIQNLWLTNLERAIFARELALLLKVDADLAYSGSLLQDFLLPILSNEMDKIYVKFLSFPDNQRPSLVDFEQRNLGWDHAFATAQILHAWGLPDDIVCVVRLHHEGLSALQNDAYRQTAIAPVAVAALMPDPVLQISDGLDQLIKLDALWPQLKLTELASRVNQELALLTPLAAQHGTLSRRLEKYLAAAT